MGIATMSRGSRPLSVAGRIARMTASALVASVFAGMLVCIAGNAAATILTFDQARSATGSTVIPTQAGSAVPQDYGDRVSGTPMAVPGGEFTYGNGGEGFTPNVVVDYFSGNNVALWTTQYGDLINVMFSSAGSNVMNVRLTADSGFEVLLYQFEIAGWPESDYTINEVTVTGAGTTLFSQTNVLVEGNATGPRHTLFDFASPLIGPELLIGIDFANIAFGQQDNIGIDNIRFSQNPPPVGEPMLIPEPRSIAIFGMSLALLGLIRHRGS